MQAKSLEPLARNSDPGDTTKHVLSGVLAILGETDLSWGKVLASLRQPQVFLDRVRAVEVANISDQALSRLQQQTAQRLINLGELQGAVRSLAIWVLAVEASRTDIKSPQAA